MASAPTSISLPEQRQEPFTFASPVSEAYEDALEFDYESWIEQSKNSNHCTSQDNKLWMDDTEAIKRNHQDLLLQAMESMPEETYELSLRDLNELPLSRVATEEAMTRSFRVSTRTNKKPCRKKTPSMERAGLIIKLFMPSPSRAAPNGGRRKKSFSGSTVPSLRKKSASVNEGSMENAISQMGEEPSSTRSNSMPSESQESTNREINGLLSILQIQEVQVKQMSAGHFCL
ncbi:hypothetical protein ACP70R_010631 [Stipagrostis hirtigluma subsp. patula]